MSDRIYLVAPAGPIECLIYPMYGQYSTNWERNGWPGSEIQMYYGYTCLVFSVWLTNFKLTIFTSFLNFGGKTIRIKKV